MHDFSVMWNSMSPWGKVFFSCVVVGGIGFTSCWLALLFSSIFIYRPFAALKAELRSHHPQLLESLANRTHFAKISRAINKTVGEKPTPSEDLITRKTWNDFIVSNRGDENATLAQKKQAVRPIWSFQIRVQRIAFAFWLLGLLGMPDVAYGITKFGHP